MIQSIVKQWQIVDHENEKLVPIVDVQSGDKTMFSVDNDDFDEFIENLKNDPTVIFYTEPGVVFRKNEKEMEFELLKDYKPNAAVVVKKGSTIVLSGPNIESMANAGFIETKKKVQKKK